MSASVDKIKIPILLHHVCGTVTIHGVAPTPIPNDDGDFFPDLKKIKYRKNIYITLCSWIKFWERTGLVKTFKKRNYSFMPYADQNEYLTM